MTSLDMHAACYIKPNSLKTLVVQSSWKSKNSSDEILLLGAESGLYY